MVFWSDWRTPHEVTPTQRSRWAISAWYHHDEPTRAEGGEEPEKEGGKADTARVGIGGGGVGEISSFGTSKEEIESFLLALWHMNGGDAAQPTEAKGAHYKRNVRSW